MFPHINAKGLWGVKDKHVPSGCNAFCEVIRQDTDFNFSSHSSFAGVGGIQFTFPLRFHPVSKQRGAHPSTAWHSREEHQLYVLIMLTGRIRRLVDPSASIEKRLNGAKTASASCVHERSPTLLQARSPKVHLHLESHRPGSVVTNHSALVVTNSSIKGDADRVGCIFSPYE